MPPFSDMVFPALLVFAATATASVALQNVLWIPVAWGLRTVFTPGQKADLRPKAFFWATFLFTMSFFLGALGGVDPRHSFETVHKYLILLAFLPLAALGLNSKQIRKLLILFTAGSAVCALWGSSRYFLHLTTRIKSFSGHWMVFGGLLMLAFLIAYFYILEKPRRTVPWILAGLTGVGLVLTQTRGAWVACLFGTLFLTFRFKRALIPWMLASLAAGFFLLPSTLQYRVRSIFQTSPDYQNSNHERILILKAGLAMIRDHPVFGIGQGNMETEYPKYRLPNAAEDTVGHLHNTPAQILAQNGWVGFAAYLFWLAAYTFQAWRFRAPDSDTGNLHILLTCLFASSFLWSLTEYSFSHQFMMTQTFLVGLQAGLWRAGSKTA